MEPIFNSESANKSIAPLIKDLNEIIETLELVDNLMPSSSKELKVIIDESKKLKFKEITENPIDFVDWKSGLFLLDMKELRMHIYKSDIHKYQTLADAIVICSCKILGFAIGKVSCYSNKKDFSDTHLLEVNNNHLLEIKRILHHLTQFDITNTGENEIIKTDKLIMKLSKVINKKSFWGSLFKK